jgi:FMN-dependent NADH-azoreductase
VRTPAQGRSWAIARPLIEELLAADVLLIATPMYNFTIPSTLKAWIDQVSFPWLPVAGLTVIVATARGGAYGPGTPRERYDYQEPYLRAYFETLGITDVHFLHTELTNALHVPFLAELKDAHETSRTAALEAAIRLARTVRPTGRTARLTLSASVAGRPRRQDHHNNNDQNNNDQHDKKEIEETWTRG